MERSCYAQSVGYVWAQIENSSSISMNALRMQILAQCLVADVIRVLTVLQECHHAG